MRRGAAPQRKFHCHSILLCAHVVALGMSYRGMFGCPAVGELDRVVQMGLLL
jgi:hypothetical protein